MQFNVFIFNNRWENYPSFLLLMSLCSFSRSWSSSALLSSEARGLRAAAGLQRGRGTRGRCRHTLLSAFVSPFVRKQNERSSRLIRKFLKEGFATALSCLAFCSYTFSLDSAYLFLYPMSCSSSPHSSLLWLSRFALQPSSDLKHVSNS